MIQSLAAPTAPWQARSPFLTYAVIGPRPTQLRPTKWIYSCEIPLYNRPHKSAHVEEPEVLLNVVTMEPP
jgi:hypothetical protein